MNHDEQFRAWIEPFDVFISYARADNGGPEPAVWDFVEQLQADFHNFSPEVRLKVFFDERSVFDGQYWQNQIYKGLRQSKSMLAFLSKAYFESEWCMKEWDEYVRLEQARTFPGEALTPIFIVAPPDLEKQLPPEALERYQAALQRNAVVDLVPYWNQGRKAFQEQLVRDRMQRIRDTIHARVEFGRRLEAVPRSTFERNPRFTGRDSQIAELRDQLLQYSMAGLCAVNGAGGVGKSSVAREYAHRFRPEYMGGQFEINLANVTALPRLQSEFVRLALLCHVDIPYTLPEDEQYRRALDHFNGMSPKQKVLVILDNLEEDATRLVSAANRRLLPSAEKVHYLITTRADQTMLGGLSTLRLDVLLPSEGLDVLFAYKTFAFRGDDAEYLAVRQGQMPATYEAERDDAEWKAALAIVNKLGRHALAVSLVGAYLGTYNIGYREFLREMEARGIGLALERIGHDEAVNNLISHPVPLLSQLFDQSLARLTPLALRTLEYAAFLPPDLVPLSWLEALVGQDAQMQGHLQADPFPPTPWQKCLQSLDGLDYLKGGEYARMHRVVQEVVKGRMSIEDQTARRGSILAWIDDRAADVHDGRTTYHDLREVEAVLAWTRGEADSGDYLVGRTATWLVSVETELGRLGLAMEMARLGEQILRKNVEDDPDSAEKKRDLSISFNKLGDVSMKSGDLQSARRYFEDGLQIRRELADADPHSAEKKRDLSISLSKLGDVSVTSGDLQSARRYFEDVLQISRELADADPNSAEKKRDLSISLERLGDVSVASGDLQSARRYLEDGLQISRELADADPHSAEKKRDLWVSHYRIANLMEQGNEPGAQEHWRQAHDILASMVAAGLFVSQGDMAFLDQLKSKLDG